MKKVFRHAIEALAVVTGMLALGLMRFWEQGVFPKVRAFGLMSASALVGTTLTGLDPTDPDSVTVKHLAFNIAPSGYEMLPGGWVKIDLTAGIVNTFPVALQNPFGHDVLINHAVIDITTAGGTATAVLDVDITTSATGTGDDIFDGVDANAAATISSFAAGAGTNAEHTAWKWEKAGGSNDYVTAKALVETVAAIVGHLYLQITDAG